MRHSDFENIAARAIATATAEHKLPTEPIPILTPVKLAHLVALLAAGKENVWYNSGDFEYCLRDFISKLLALFSIDDTPSFQWNRIANQLEETQMVLTAATYLDDEAVLRHLPWLTPEEVDEILKRRVAEDMERLGVTNDGLGAPAESEVTEDGVIGT